MFYMPEEHRNRNLRRAELRQVALGGHHLHDGLPAEILVEILRHRHRHGQVLGALDDVARHRHAPQEVPQIEREYCTENAQRYVRPHIEQSPAKLLHRHRVHIAADHQRREPRHPRLVVRLHRGAELVDLLLLESSVVIDRVQKPKNRAVEKSISPNLGQKLQRTQVGARLNYLGEAEIMMILWNRSGRKMEAMAPVIEDREWPTKIHFSTLNSSKIASRS